MAGALLDTNVLFANASARDEFHEQASKIIRGVDHGELPKAVVTNYVVAETLNLANERLGHEAANGLLDRLIEGAHFEIVHATQADFTAAQVLFRRHSGLSFVDATIAAYMARDGIDYLYSFDDDFDAIEGLTRLETANSPHT